MPYTPYFEPNRDTYFDFSQAILPSERLTYELLSPNNYLILLEMFAQDENPFVDSRFKNPQELEEYADYMFSYAAFSPTRGGADWLFRDKNGKHLGILHLYDLSLANNTSAQESCTIGFATIQEYRAKGISFEAVTHFLTYVRQVFGKTKIWAYTLKNNTAAKQFMQKVGFILDSKQSENDSRYDFYLLKTAE
jgi:RimJ/RimL family protein N-acetyltransferase